MAIDRNKIQKQAENYVASGKMDRAIDEFLKLLEDKPNDLMMMNRIGDLYLQSARTREAIDMFKRAGMGYEHDGFIPKAAAVFKKAGIPYTVQNVALVHLSHQPGSLAKILARLPPAGGRRVGFSPPSHDRG